MSKELVPTGVSSLREGTYAAINIVDPVAFNTYLERHREPHYILHERGDSAPGSLHEFSLEVGICNPEDMHIVAAQSFSIGSLPMVMEPHWQEWVATHILERIDTDTHKIHHLDHQLYDFYVEISSEYAVRVHFSTSTTSCTVSTSLVYLGEVYYAADISDDQFDNNMSNQQSPDYAKVLDEFSSIWSRSLDASIQLTSADRTPPPIPLSIVINPADEDTTSPASTPREEVTPHESEMSTRTLRGLEQVGGAFSAKDRLRRFSLVFSNPAAAEMYGISSSGHFLLHGPPGTGKSTLAAAFAEEIDAELRNVQSTDIVSEWVGASGKNIREVFDNAKMATGPLVLFFDEFDAIASKDSSGTNERVDVRKQLNTLLEDISRNYPNIVVVAATNVGIDKLEPSLVRSGRIESISLSVPNQEELLDLWGIIFYQSFSQFSQISPYLISKEGKELNDHTFMPYANDINPVILARQSPEGFTGADIQMILDNARREAMERYIQTGEAVQVCQSDLLRALEQYGR